VRTNLIDLQGYAFCPIFYKMDGSLQIPVPPALLTLRNLITYMYSRQLEVGRKITFEEVQNTWNRSWWSEYDLKDQAARKANNTAILGLSQAYQYYSEDERQVLAVNLPYFLHIEDHVICGDIPLVLCDPDSPKKISVLDIGPPISINELTRDLRIRAAALMVEQNIGVMPSIIEVLCFNRNYKLTHTCLYPTHEFQDRSRAIFTGLLKAAKGRIFYPNFHSCNICEFNHNCMI
jgi:hypothetical protein